MASSSEEINPLEKLRALRTEVIDRERTRMRGLLDEVPTSEQEAAGETTVAEPNSPTAEDSDAASERKPKKGKAARRSASLEGEELKIRLGTELRRLVALQCHADGWSVNDLVSSVLRSALSARSPSIWHGGTALATSNVCRFWHRHPMDTALRLTSDKGVFLITTNPASPLFKHWKEHYTLLGMPDCDRMARQMRLIQLQEWVQSVDDFDVDDWRKPLSEEDYLVTRAVVSQQDVPTDTASRDDETNNPSSTQ
jgi:predicted HicB family RNase H-like nuclease